MVNNKIVALVIGAILLFSVGSAFMFSGKKAPIPRDTGPGDAGDMSDHHGGAPVSQKQSYVSKLVGTPAPDFTLEDIDGNQVKLSDYKGKKVVLFFNEGSMCYPACWDQMSALANDVRFNNDGIVALSIVAEPKNEWKKIVQQVTALKSAKILFDSTKKISSSYDVLSTPSSMHPGSFPGHTYFIIDEAGVISFALDDKSMAINNDLLASKLGV